MSSSLVPKFKLHRIRHHCHHYIIISITFIIIVINIMFYDVSDNQSVSCLHVFPPIKASIESLPCCKHPFFSCTSWRFLNIKTALVRSGPFLLAEYKTLIPFKYITFLSRPGKCYFRKRRYYCWQHNKGEHYAGICTEILSCTHTVFTYRNNKHDSPNKPCEIESDGLLHILIVNYIN